MFNETTFWKACRIFELANQHCKWFQGNFSIMSLLMQRRSRHLCLPLPSLCRRAAEIITRSHYYNHCGNVVGECRGPRRRTSMKWARYLRGGAWGRHVVGRAALDANLRVCGAAQNIQIRRGTSRAGTTGAVGRIPISKWRPKLAARAGGRQRWSRRRQQSYTLCLRRGR